MQALKDTLDHHDQKAAVVGAGIRRIHLLEYLRR